jgi:hypothetical protein
MKGDETMANAKSVLKELETNIDDVMGCLPSGTSFLGVHWMSQAA